MCLRASRLLSHLCVIPMLHWNASTPVLHTSTWGVGVFGVFCFAVLGLEHSLSCAGQVLNHWATSSAHVCYFLEIVWVVQTSLEHSVAQGIFKFLILLPRPPKITACAIGSGILLLFYFVKGFSNCMGILPEYMAVHHMYSSYLRWPEEVVGYSDLKL